MEEELIFGLIIVCLIFLFIIIGIAVISLLTEKKGEQKLFKKKFNYKKIDNLYEEFVYSNEDKFGILEYNIKLCYFVILGDFVAIPMLVLYLFMFECTKSFVYITLGIAACLVVILHYVYSVELPILLDRKNELFKNGLIKYIIKECLDDFKYEPDNGIDDKEYSLSKFYEPFNAYFSEDKMSGKMGTSKVVMAEVETLNKDGDKISKPLFHGLYAHVSLKDKIKNDVIITSKEVTLSNRELVYTTSDKFNEYYNTYTNKNITTYALLNKEAITKLLELAELSDIIVDIKISKNDIFLRFGTGPLFDGLIFSKDEKKRLYEFTLITEIIRCINDSVISISK